MKIQLIDLIENFLDGELGVNLSNEALRACDDLSADQLDFLRTSVYDWDRGHHEALVNRTDADNPEEGKEPDKKEKHNETDRSFSAMYSHPYNGLQPVQIDQIKRQLLFFPKIAIVRPEFEYDLELPKVVSSFKNFIASLVDLADLLRDGTIEFLPLSGFYSNEIEGGAGLIRRACEEEKELQDWIESNSDVLDDFRKGARPNDPYFDAGIRIASALSYGNELVATHPFVGELYAQLIGDQALLSRETTAVVSQLEHIKLPGLAGLAWTDVKAIREDENSFRRWRSDLKEVLATIDLELTPDKYVDRFNSIAHARLGRAAIDVDEDIKKSGALTRLRSGAVGFAIGAVASAATLATFGVPAGTSLWTALLKVVETGGVSAGLQFLWGHKRQTGKNALRSHYSVFAPEK